MAKKATKKIQGELFDRPAVVKRDTLKGRNIRRQVTALTAAESLGEISPGCEIYCLTMGKFSLVDVIEHVLKTTGPADVVLSTWTAANADLGFAFKMMTNGDIRSMKFVVDYSFSHRQPSYCAALREKFGDEAIRFTKNHAKFVTITNDEWSIVIRTSMNLNECKRLESLEVSDDRAMGDFLNEIIDRLFANQNDTFDRSAGEYEKNFEDDLDLECDGSRDLRFFGDGPMDVDLDRVGPTYRS